jgi:hypothetical protein
MFDTYKDRTLVQMKIHANQQRTEIDRLREALKELLAAWPADSLPPHALCMKVADAINNPTV